MQAEPVSDAELIVRVRSGDIDAMGELYARHRDAALRVARATSGDAHLAEDLVSSAFERVQLAIARGHGPDDSFRAYLYTVIRRLAAEHGVAAARELDTDDFAPYEAATAIHDDGSSLEAQLVAKAFATLPERHQAVLWYLEVEGLTPLQAAPLFGLSPNATSALAVRARDALRTAYIQAHVSDDPVHADCAPTRRLLGGYLRSTLSPRAAARVEAHLMACDECPIVLEELKDVGYGLRSVFGPLLIGGGAIGAVLAALGGGKGDAAMAVGLAGAGAAGTAAAGSGAAAPPKHAARAATAAVSVLAALGLATVVSAAVNVPSAQSAPGPSPAAIATPAAAATPAPPSETPVPTPAVPPAPPVQAPAPEAPQPVPSSPEPAVPPPPEAALSLDLRQDVELPDGGWLGALVASVRNTNATPITARLSVVLPEGIVLDAARVALSDRWACDTAASPLVCTATGIPAGAELGLELPVTISVDALDARPVASLTIGGDS